MIEIREADPCERSQAFAVRRRVFVTEQGVPHDLEFDAFDDHARHLVLVEHGRVLGTLRMRWLGDGRTVKIERVAVVEQARGRGLGRLLMRRGLKQALADGAERVLVHAQVRVRSFYKSLGFEGHGQVFEEDGILHIAMHRDLDAASERETTA